MTTLGLVLGGAALVGVGVGIGAHLQGRRIHHPRDLEQIAHLAGQLREVEQANTLLAQSAVRAWRLVEAAGLQRLSREPEALEVPEDQVEQGRRNRRLN